MKSQEQNDNPPRATQKNKKIKENHVQVGIKPVFSDPSRPPYNQSLKKTSSSLEQLPDSKIQKQAPNNPSLIAPSLMTTLSPIPSTEMDSSDDEMSSQTSPPAAASNTTSTSHKQMPNWMTSEEGQSIFVSIMAHARGAHGDYSQSLGHGNRRSFFCNLAETQFLPGGILEEYAPISSTMMQRRFVQATQYIKSQYDLQGSHSVGDEEEDTWPQAVTAYMDFVKWHDNIEGEQSKQKGELMEIQRSIIGQQPPFKRRMQNPCTGSNTRQRHSINDLGENTQVQVHLYPYQPHEPLQHHSRRAARRSHSVACLNHQNQTGIQATLRRQQRQNFNSTHVAQRIQNITALTFPLLEQISMMNNKLDMSLAGSQLRPVTAIREDIYTVLSKRQDVGNSSDIIGRHVLDEQLDILQQELKDRQSFDHMLMSHCEGIDVHNTSNSNNQGDVKDDE